MTVPLIPQAPTVEGCRAQIEPVRDSLEQQHRQPRTVQSTVADVRQFLDYLGDDPSLTSDRILAYLRWLDEQEGRQQATLRRKLVSVRTFLHHLVRLGLTESNAAEPITVESNRAPTLVPLSALGCRQLLQAAETDPRWNALLLVLLTTGLKKSEALALDWSDLTWDDQRVAQRLTVRAAGRGVRARTLRVPPVTGAALGRHAAAADPPWATKGRVFTLSARGFDYMIRRGAEQAGLDHLPVTAQLLRDTFAVTLLSALMTRERQTRRGLSPAGQARVKRGYESGFLRVLGVGRNAALLARYRIAVAESEEPDGAEGAFLSHTDLASADEL